MSAEQVEKYGPRRALEFPSLDEERRPGQEQQGATRRQSSRRGRGVASSRYDDFG